MTMQRQAQIALQEVRWLCRGHQQMKPCNQRNVDAQLIAYNDNKRQSRQLQTNGQYIKKIWYLQLTKSSSKYVKCEETLVSINRSAKEPSFTKKQRDGVTTFLMAQILWIFQSSAASTKTSYSQMQAVSEWQIRSQVTHFETIGVLFKHQSVLKLN